MKKSTKRKFVLNLLVTYHENINPINYREPIHCILRHLAWLHSLDYVIDAHTTVFDNVPPKTTTEIDIIYIRSSKDTHINLKEFQKLIENIFFNSKLNFLSGVNVSYQIQAARKLYPFPSEFYRPLNYPFVEHYKGAQKTLYMYKEALSFPLNLFVANEN